MNVSAPPPVASPRGLVRKPIDDIGRVRIYFDGRVPLSEYLDKCRLLEREITEGPASRWSVRGLVTDMPTDTELRERLGAGGPIEVNRLPVRIAGREQEYLWVSRNSPDRLPDADARQRFADRIAACGQFQDQVAPNFADHTRQLLDRARAAGLSLVCNDPFEEWGTDQVDADTFARLIGELFYVGPESARLMTRGRGYSTSWHYLFGLRDRAGELLAVFVLAKWPWGFEATYTMMNRAYAGDAVGAGGANLLMLLSSALLLSRHGTDTLVYGEANAANCRPCVQAGYRIVPLDLGGTDPLVHRNVVWADNPIGAPDTSAEAPHHSIAEYISYVLMRLDTRAVAPFTDQALDFLAVR